VRAGEVERLEVDGLAAAAGHHAPYPPTGLAVGRPDQQREPGRRGERGRDLQDEGAAGKAEPVRGAGLG
jgi:hypothetical protein